MTTRVPLTKALIRYLIEHAERFEWSLQGFGMFRLYLNHDTRIHIWDPRFAVDRVTTIHTHPWHFRSEVVWGAITDRTFRIVQGDDSHVEQQIVCGPGGCAVDGTTRNVRLELAHERRIYAGDCYSLLADELHETIPESGTVTVITRRFLPDTEHALVYYPVGTPWVSAEPRPATQEEKLQMRDNALRWLE